MTLVPGIFLVRTKNFWYNTVCPYKMPDTVVHWYSTRAVPGRPGLNHGQCIIHIRSTRPQRIKVRLEPANAAVVRIRGFRCYALVESFY